MTVWVVGLGMVVGLFAWVWFCRVKFGGPVVGLFAWLVCVLCLVFLVL